MDATVVTLKLSHVRGVNFGCAQCEKGTIDDAWLDLFTVLFATGYSAAFKYDWHHHLFPGAHELKEQSSPQSDAHLHDFKTSQSLLLHHIFRDGIKPSLSTVEGKEKASENVSRRMITVPQKQRLIEVASWSGVDLTFSVRQPTPFQTLVSNIDAVWWLERVAVVVVLVLMWRWLM